MEGCFSAIRFAVDARPDALAEAVAHGVTHSGARAARISIPYAVSACDLAYGVVLRRSSSSAITAEREFASDARALLEGQELLELPLWPSGNWLNDSNEIQPANANASTTVGVPTWSF